MIPQDMIEDALAKAEGATFLGKPIKELSKDELIVCAITGWEQVAQERETAERERKFLMTLYKRR